MIMLYFRRRGDLETAFNKIGERGASRHTCMSACFRKQRNPSFQQSTHTIILSTTIAIDSLLPPQIQVSSPSTSLSTTTPLPPNPIIIPLLLSTFIPTSVLRLASQQRTKPDKDNPDHKAPVRRDLGHQHHHHHGRLRLQDHGQDLRITRNAPAHARPGCRRQDQ